MKSRSRENKASMLDIPAGQSHMKQVGPRYILKRPRVRRTPFGSVKLKAEQQPKVSLPRVSFRRQECEAHADKINKDVFMCGILLSISHEPNESSHAPLIQLLKQRGPDSFKQVRVKVCPQGGKTEDAGCNDVVNLTFIATVLSLRGESVVEQPIVDESSGSILCWNGEAWRIGANPVGDHDTTAVFAHLLTSASCHFSPDEHAGARFGQCYEDCSSASLLRTLQAITGLRGPYTLVFFDRVHQRLFFARDPLGRRSLVYRTTDAGSLILASISDGDQSKSWSEIGADGIYVLDCSVISGPAGSAQVDVVGYNSNIPTFPMERYPWVDSADTRLPDTSLCLPISFGPLNKTLPQTEPPPLQSYSQAVMVLEEKVRASMLLRVKDIPLPPIQGPKGIDSEVARVAVLFSGGVDCTVLARVAHDIVPLSQAIDLLNVAFENPRAVKAAGITSEARNDCHVGLNSLPPVPLSENGDERRVLSSNGSNRDPGRAVYDICPDRKTGRVSLHELKPVCPQRTWNFVEINVSHHEALLHRDRVIALMHPHNTEMDLSIAYAFYFAARGAGVILDETSQQRKAYTTPARVLLSGLGADELFAGYTRHAVAFTRMGFPGLLDELELDFNRLGKRNLGRDDRVIAHWGKEARYPYLDEDLLRWALACPVWEKCGFGQQKFSQDDIEPGKRVLRLLAQKLGMAGAALEKKRAIQFGARTAKMETGKTKGTQIISPQSSS